MECLILGAKKYLGSSVKEVTLLCDDGDDDIHV
jgi:hypothetical protein